MLTVEAAAAPSTVAPATSMNKPSEEPAAVASTTVEKGKMRGDSSNNILRNGARKV